LGSAEVTRVLAALGASPDPFLLALYSWHDGAAGSGQSAELMDMARFMSLDEALRTREFELQLAAEVESLPDTPAAKIFNPSWFPLLTDPSGRVYVVEDFGRGKVLIIDRMAIDSPDELSASLIEFFDRLARDGMDYKPQPPSADAAVLVSRLESIEPGVRVKATNELVQKRPRDAFEPLVALLESDDHQVRREAALILGELRDRRAIPILIHCLAHWTGVDVASAWGGLLAVGKESPLEHLERTLADAESELRLDSIKGLVLSQDGEPCRHSRPLHCATRTIWFALRLNKRFAL